MSLTYQLHFNGFIDRIGGEKIDYRFCFPMPSLVLVKEPIIISCRDASIPLQLISKAPSAIELEQTAIRTP